VGAVNDATKNQNGISTSVPPGWP